MKLWKGLTGKNIYFDGAKSALILEDWFRWTMTENSDMGFFRRNFKYAAPEDIIHFISGTECRR